MEKNKKNMFQTTNQLRCFRVSTKNPGFRSHSFSPLHESIVIVIKCPTLGPAKDGCQGGPGTLIVLCFCFKLPWELGEMMGEMMGSDGVEDDILQVCFYCFVCFEFDSAFENHRGLDTASSLKFCVFQSVFSRDSSHG